VFGGGAEDSFDVLVPSLPGFGFSSRMTMTDRAVADLWAKLMIESFGYKKFMAAGGDLGSGVTRFQLYLQYIYQYRCSYIQ
jgi:pimeloyl-ACP methyl ester carboxylesterase